MKQIIKKNNKVIVNGTKVTLKLGIILGLILILLIPQNMIKNLVRDREYRQEDVIQNIAQQVGGYEDITGPILCIPYLNEVETFRVDNKGKTIKEIEVKQRTAFFAAEKLTIQSDVHVENKQKSIYKVPFFKAKNTLTGTFPTPDFTQWNKHIKEENIQWNEAYLVLGVSDVKGISENPTLLWNEKTLDFESSVNNTRFITSGIHVKLPKNWKKEKNSFRINLQVRGTQSLNFAGTAKTNELMMKSNWPHPNFESTMNAENAVHVSTPPYNVRNSTLPSEREIFDDGFSASWKESQFSIDRKMQWLSEDEQPNLHSRLMGTEFINVVDHYEKTNRSTKYMALIVALVFICFFIIELLKGNRIHPFQYILVGSAIAIFFILLLALSEYFGFNIAYLIAAVSTVVLIGLYSLSVFTHKTMALTVSVLLSLLFSFIFVLLIATEYSLLIGAIGLFGLLAIIMFVTRKVEWYNSTKP